MAKKGRRAGLSDAAAAENAGQARKWKPGSPQEALLKRSLTWSPDEWLTLSQLRRLFLFAQAKPVAESGAQVEALILGLIDRLAVRGQGEELDAWLGMLELKEPKQRGIIIAGERGKQLLALEPSTGFKERAVIAHRESPS
ncbi:MAG: hypothetical protein IPJ65_43320 [Archangiaceae bacterium]|nr:hypothetical protein [Archangiaceae bacterium]